MLAFLGFKEHNLQPCENESMIEANESSLSTVYSLKVWASLGPRETAIQIIVCSDVSKMLLSWYDSIALGMLPADYPDQITRQVDTINQRGRPSQPVIDNLKNALTTIPGRIRCIRPSPKDDWNPNANCVARTCRSVL